MNENLFSDMIAGFAEAKKYRAGRKATVRFLVWLSNPFK